MESASYRAGDSIIVEGEYTSDAYIIERGSVEVYLAGPPERRLRTLRAGEIFGEMALITEQPRSASIRALEDVEVRVVHRDDFLVIWQHDPSALLPVLKVLCERVRTLTGLVEELSRHSVDFHQVAQVYLGGGDTSEESRARSLASTGATLEGITSVARTILGDRVVILDELPFRIGRATTPPDPLGHNHLVIVDHEPFRVSRNHCMIARVDDRWFLVDRGSQWGTLVNGTLVGGAAHVGRVQLWAGPNDLTIGGRGTSYRFRLTVTAPA
jgi:CRP-like cAMP-binding protein